MKGGEIGLAEDEKGRETLDSGQMTRNDGWMSYTVGCVPWLSQDVCRCIYYIVASYVLYL